MSEGETERNKTVTTEEHGMDYGSIYTIYLDQVETRNSMTLEMGLSFSNELNRLASLDPLPRSVIITGKNGVFSSGGDLKLLRSFAEKSFQENEEFMEAFYRLFLAVRNAPFPVIGAINGHAIGASLAVALACDLRYFVADAQYAFNFVRIGIHPGMGSTLLAKEIAGLGQAQELLFTGKYITGEDALRRGLCHGLFEKESMHTEVLKIATDMAGASPLAQRLLKKNLYKVHDLDEALKIEATAQAHTYETEDFREALQAIQEKRKPIYRDK